MFSSLNISASALTASRLRMDVISSNMANAETTRGELVDGNWIPYRRKSVVLQEQGQSFSSIFNSTLKEQSSGSGVKVSKIVEDSTPFKLVYNPSHPDANEDGYVQMPNVDPLREMVDLLSTTRTYEANVTVLNASKAMLLKTLEIGK
ncbi:flagellar basal body rod protein FlgC [Fervidibacillus halotolerans]|uniref:Flagellar basal-body rod protein FlgC n=1 Tax=Fervidibacillus halotolerans TaxID=2980027 RepID=A0A9E8RZQ5_9BACI|nr:flagellar basal body rod protein FlgC [Fervidibacillus halotolerans]WAA13608.1 flagellar basal body rod protein FlgC [Fervidibacillus halotolerans]